MRLVFVRQLFLYYLGTTLGLSACGPEAEGADSFPAAAERRRTAATPVEWGVSDSSSEFTDITAVDVDGSGHVYVADFYRQQVTVLSLRGQPDRVIGRKGSGPGEFRSIRSIQVIDGDSLLVYDPSLARVSIYAPDAAAPAYTVDLGPQLGGAAPFFLWKLPKQRKYLALFRPAFVFSGGKTDLKRRDVVRVLESDGARGAEILSFPSRSFLISGTSVTPNPFGREGIVQPRAAGGDGAQQPVAEPTTRREAPGADRRVPPATLRTLPASLDRSDQ